MKDHVGDIVKNGQIILVGDANGADKAIQQFVAEKKYQSVIVFCSGDVCRNNLGNWKTRSVQTNRSSRDFAFYAAKDLAMSKEADYGFMLWDGKSKGTLSNILTLLENSKRVLVYFSPKHLFVKLFSIRDLAHFIKHCEAESLTYFEKTLNINERLSSDDKLFELA